MSNSDGQIIIQVMLDDKEAKKGLDGIDKETGKLDKSASGKFKNVAKGVAAVGTAALGAVGLIVGVGAAIGGLAAPLVKAAGDARAMNAQFSTVFGDLEKTAAAALNRIGEETSILPDRLKGSFTQMAAFAKTTGMETADALALTERATLAAADSAAFYDKSIEEVTENLQSFLKGNYENDAALGISATETTRNAKANELYGQSFNDLSEAQKQLTLLAMVEDGNKLSGALGQAAREGDGLENVIGNFKQAWENLKVALGEPILDIAIAGIKGLTDIIQNFNVEPFISAFEAIKSNITSNSEAIKNVAVQAFEFAKTGIETVLNYVVPFVQGQLAKVQQFWAENGAQIIQAVQNFANIVTAIFNFFLPALKFLVEYIWTAIKNVISGALDVIMGVVKVFTGLFTGDWSKMWEGIKQLLSGAVNLILGIMSLTFVGGIRTALTNLAKTAINLVKGKWTSIVGFFKTGVSNAQTTVSNLVTKVITFFKNLATNAKTTISNLKTNIVNTFQKMKDDAVAKAQSLKDDIIAKLKSIDLKQIGKDIINGLISGIGSMKDFVLDIIEDTVGSAIDFAKKLLGIASPSKVFKQFGKWISEGLAIGIEDDASKVQTAVTNLANTAAKATTDVIKAAEATNKKFRVTANKEILAVEKQAAAARSKVTRDEEQKISRLIAKEQNAKKKNATKLAQDISTIEKKAAEQRKQVSEKAQKDILKVENGMAAKRLQAYKDDVEARKQAGTLSVKAEMEYWKTTLDTFTKGSKQHTAALKLYNTAASNYNKERLDNIKSYIDEKKKLDQLSLMDEAIIWEQNLSTFEKGSKEYLEAQKAYKAALDNVHNEILSINETYQQKMQIVNDNLVKSIADLNKEYETEFTRLVSLYTDFAGTFDDFTVEFDVTGEQLMTSMGNQVNALNQYEQLFAELANRGVGSELLDEIGSLGVKALPQLKALVDMTDDQLSSYESLYSEKSAKARQMATTELEGMRLDTEQKIIELRATADTELDKLYIEWQDKIKGVTTVTSTELSSLKQIGIDAGQGLLDGLTSKESAIIGKARSIAEGIKSTIQSALDIHSPSRWMEKFIVGNLAKGFDVGVDKNIGLMQSAASKMAETIKPVLSNPLRGSSLNIGSLANPSVANYNSSASSTDNSKSVKFDVVNNFTPAESTPYEASKKQEQMLRRLAMQL